MAGIRLHGTGQAVRVAPDGRQASTAAPITLDEEEIGAVRLERPGPLLLDRLATAAAAVVERYGPDHHGRPRAQQGFAAGLPVRVAAVRSRFPLAQVGLPGPPGKAALLAEVGALATTIDPAAAM